MEHGDPVWREEVIVRSHEIDARGRLSPVALASWLQEAAGGNATALGWAVDQLAERGVTWVLSRLHVAMGRLPVWRERIVVETWPAGVERVWALRQFRLLAGGEEIGRVATGWLLINLASRRPLKPPREIEEASAGGPGCILDDRFAALPEPDEEATAGGRTFDVRFSELDINHHVNNVSMIGWMVDTLPDELLETAGLAELEVDFRAEGRTGDVVRSVAANAGTNLFLHRLRREADGREVARARSRWRPD